ncbi:MAG: acyl-CoA dehydrogenase family protein [Deltaproteobacteria bacterium]
MNLKFDEDQEELRRSARAFLAEHSSSAKVREAMATEEGFDRELWRRISEEMGWPALLFAEEHGGYGLGPVDLTALLEEMGRALLCSPFFASVVLAGQAIQTAGSEAQKAQWLPAIASGTTIGTLALTEASGRWDASGIEMTARREGENFVLEGTKTFVPDGGVADLFVVAVRVPGSVGEAGVSLFVVPAETAGVERRILPTVDQTRRQGEVTFAKVSVPATALLGAEGSGWAALAHTLDLAAVALGAEQVGSAQAILDQTVQYAKERVQFGRPIGSFQAVKHKCADMLVAVESARSAVYFASAAAAEGSAELPQLASMAKAYCSDAFFRCAADAIQVHGGVGFTWEYDCHLFFKRAKSSESFLGDPAYHRERVARCLEI